MSRARTWRSNTAGPRINSIAAGAGGRTGSPAGRRDRRDRQLRFGARGQGGNHDDPDRLRRRRRPGQARSCRQPRPAGRQPDRCQFFQSASWRQSGWNSCASWCPQQLALPCSSIRPMLRLPKSTLRDVEAAARAMGLQIQVLNASTSREIDAAFATFVRERPDALFVGADPFFISRRVQLATWRRAMRFPRSICVA